MGAINPQVVASLDPRSMVGRTCVGDHTKYIICGFFPLQVYGRYMLLTTRVPIQSAQKPYSAFSQPGDALHEKCQFAT